MTNCHGNTHSEQAKMEQIVTEFFAKSLHIILESRTLCVSSSNFNGDHDLSSPSSSSSSSPSVRPRDKWFNLALRECPAALENFDLWRESNFEPLVVDVVLVQRPLDSDPMSVSSQKDLVRNLSLLERCSSSDQEDLGCAVKREKIIERWVVQYESRKGKNCSSKGKRRSSNSLLHVLYKKSTLLLRSLYTTMRILPAYKIFRGLNLCTQAQPFTLAHRVSSYVEPFTFTRGEETEMEFFRFNPVDTSSGRLCLSVMYRASVSDVISEPSSPSPMSPQMIHDYVGSPLADRLKRFPSLPVSQGSPSSLPFSRRHSFDQYRASPPPPETSLPHKKNANFDECCLSPNYALSQSPSPPIHVPKSHQTRGLLGSESAHVKRFAKPVTSQNEGTVEKLSSIGKDEAKKFSGLKIPSKNLPEISISRSSSQSFPDDSDEPDFACAFDVDYDIMDPGSRPESFDQKGRVFEPLEPGGFFPIRKSQDAAVGALVHMLKKAPPLHQHNSCSVNISQEPNKICKAPTIHNADSIKTTADALEELRSYRDMKVMLLQQGDKLPGKEHGDKSDTLTGEASVI